MILSAVARAERLPIKVYTTADGLASSVILSIVPDSRGFLWFATRSGLSRFDGSEFRTYTTADGLPHPVVNHVLETRDGEYWIATNGGGVCRFNVGGGASQSTPRRERETAQEPLFSCREVGPDFVSNRVNVLYEDRQRRIWVGTDRGVFWLERNNESWRLVRASFDSLRDDAAFAARDISEDTLGRLWIGSSAGVLRRDPDGRAKWYMLPAHSQPGGVRGIAEHEGELWMGSRSGVIAVRPESRILESGTHQTLDPGPTCVEVETGMIVVPKAEGESCHLDVTSGLPNNQVRALFRSPVGRLWIGTSGGLSYLDGRRLTSLATAEQVGGANLDALSQDRDGHIWIGTSAGAMRLAIDGLVSYGPSDGLGHPRIDAIAEHRDGTIFAVSGEWVVNRFDGGRFHAVRPRVIDSWLRLSTPPESLVGSGRPLFTVLPPVWQRWWFVSLVMAGFVGLGYSLHRVRVRRLLDLERVRARIAADLHDDIGGSLSRISIQSEVARRDLVEPQEASIRRLIEIGDTARSAVESLADVVWSVDPGQDDLASVERRVREYAADVLGARGVRWTFHGTGHLDRFALNPEARRDLLLLLKEGVTNIARHADARVASLHLHIVGGELHADLQDDGRGFDPAAVEADDGARGRGLGNMRVRAQQLNGRIAIESALGMGTRVRVSVPVGHRRRMNMRLWHTER